MPVATKCCTAAAQAAEDRIASIRFGPPFRKGKVAASKLAAFDLSQVQIRRRVG